MKKVLVVVLLLKALVLTGCEPTRNYRPEPYLHSYESRGKYTNATITTQRWK